MSGAVRRPAQGRNHRWFDADFAMAPSATDRFRGSAPGPVGRLPTCDAHSRHLALLQSWPGSQACRVTSSTGPSVHRPSCPATL